MTQQIQVDRRGTVTRVMIDRPEKLNALSAAMMDAIADAVEGCETSVLAIAGSCDRTLCAGADIGEFATGAEALARQEKALLRMIAALARARCLTITAAHGRVLGGGGMIAALSDVVLAREDLQIGFPEIRFGMFPIIVHAVLLERLPAAIAWQLCSTGRALDAEACLNLGLASQVVAADGFAATVEHTVDWYAERSAVFELMRAATRVVDAERLAARLHDVAPLMLRNYALPGVADRIRAVLQPGSTPSSTDTADQEPRR